MPRRRPATTPTRANAQLSYAVRIWSLRKVPGKKATTYEVRWIVDGREFTRPHATRAAGDSFRTELRAALNRGEGFDISCGLPVSMLPDVRETSWWDWALEYVDLKWPTLAPTSRRSLAEAMVSATMAILATDAGQPPAKQLRSAMQRWAFVSPVRKAGPPPDDLVVAVAWLSRNTRPLADLDRPAVTREVLTRLSLRLDGSQAGATTSARKRMVFHNCLVMAVERELLSTNPLTKVRWKAPKSSEVIDPATVVNPAQARALLDAVGQLPDGQRHVAFFAVLYYAGARPSEAVALHWDDIQWPENDDEWGWLHLRRSNPPVSTGWTDTRRRAPRQLKHRPAGTVRPVPCAPHLAKLLGEHRDRTSDDDPRVFRGPRRADLRNADYLPVWRAAREAALTPEQCSRGLARTPYALRHACVSTWLAAGIDPTQVAVWAGHSVAVLLRVYAHMIDNRTTDALAKIAAINDM